MIMKEGDGERGELALTTIDKHVSKSDSVDSAATVGVSGRKETPGRQKGRSYEF